MNFLLSVFFSLCVFMTPHKPLDFIKELIFLPVSGPKLAGKKVGKFILPFQEKIIKTAMDHNGHPKKNIFMGFSRKIGKSMIYSWILNYFLEEKKGFNSVVMASTFSQSQIIAGLVGDQIKFNPNIDNSKYKITRDLIQECSAQNKICKVFSKASSNLGMLNVSCVCGDELGAMQSRENLNSIVSGLALSQSRPLLLFASNPPEHETHWSNDYLKNLRQKKNWKFFDFVASMKTDPLSKQAKIEANPFYAHYEKTKSPIFKPVKDFLDEETEDAKLSAENLLNYRRMQLGQKLAANFFPWISVSDIQAASTDILKNKDLRQIIGFDVALSRDFCSAVLCLFNEETEDVYLHPILHIANVDDRRPSQKSRFREWDQAGYITIQNRPAINKNIFVSDVKNFLKENKITPEKYTWDRNLSAGFSDEFSDDPVLYRGNRFEMGYPIRWLEARAKEKKLHIVNNNPCLKWMIECSVCKGEKGNSLLDRVCKKTQCIDGAISAVFATGYFLQNRKQEFVGFHV